ncbi:MAG: PRC-barrel domain-containing protein [Pseudooceanicola sp.]
MKRILTGTTALMLASAPLFAESHMQEDMSSDTGTSAGMTGSEDTMAGTSEPAVNDDPDSGAMNFAELIRTRDISGGEIYTTNEADDEWSADTTYTNVDTNWNSIGEIEDVVLSKDGSLKGIVAEVGGFLDIADKHVMVELDRMRLVPVDDRSYAVVTNMSEEELESMESVDEAWWN